MPLKDTFPFAPFSIVILVGKILSGLQPLNDQLNAFRFTMSCERFDTPIEVYFKPNRGKAKLMKRMQHGVPIVCQGHLEQRHGKLAVQGKFFELLAPMDPFSQKPSVDDDGWRNAVRMAAGLEKIVEQAG